MGEKPYGIGKIGSLKQPMELEQLARRVKEAFGLPFVVVYGQNQVPDPVHRAAICRERAEARSSGPSQEGRRFW